MAIAIKKPVYVTIGGGFFSFNWKTWPQAGGDLYG